MLDIDASIVVCHSENKQAAATCKHTFGLHPIMVFCDNTGELLAGMLRPGNAGANTAANHIVVLDAAPAQIPDQHRHGTPLLVRAGGGGCSKAFLAHVRSLHAQGVASEFSIGWAITERERAAIATIPERVWTPAIETNGLPRDGAGLAEITHALSAAALADYPAGTRIIVRRERPHPGALLLTEAALAASVLLRATTQPFGSAAWLDYHARFLSRAKNDLDWVFAAAVVDLVVVSETS